jgi:hypothetical protein
MEQQIDDIIKFVKKANHKIVKDLEAIKTATPPPPPIIKKRKEPEPTVTVGTTVTTPPIVPIGSFVCPGRLWESPALPCVGGEKSTIPDRIRYKPTNGTKNVLLDVCRGCKNSKKRKRAVKPPTTASVVVATADSDSDSD